MGWKDAFKQGREIILSTSSRKGAPNSIVVISQGLVDGKLLISACQMRRTLANLEENKQVCVIGMLFKDYYRIGGTARLFSSGRYYTTAVRRNKGPAVLKAILVSIKEVYDLDKVKKIF